VLLDTYVYPTLGDKRLDRISVDEVNKWYDELAPGRETVRAHAYSLLRTIFTSAASERPYPLVPYNPAHNRGAGNTKRVHQVQPASLEELQTIVEELPNRYKLMALLAAWCAMRFGELAELRRGDIDLRTNRVPRPARRLPSSWAASAIRHLVLRYQHAAADRDTEIARRLSALLEPGDPQ